MIWPIIIEFSSQLLLNFHHKQEQQVSSIFIQSEGKLDPDATG
jgi:hypothetical protein